MLFFCRDLGDIELVSPPVCNRKDRFENWFHMEPLRDTGKNSLLRQGLFIVEFVSSKGHYMKKKNQLLQE